MSEEQAFSLVPRTAAGSATPPLVLVIMDGVGVGKGDRFDAVAGAATPHLDRLGATGLYRTLRAHGRSVGLPSDQDMGNSEVGHNILGAGRIFDQGAKTVDAAFASGSMWGPTWQALLRQASSPGAALHLLGLVSDGNVHASLAHLEALLRQAAADGLRRVMVHALLDGRDVPDHTADTYVARLEAVLAELSDASGGVFRIASGGGRMVTTMDRYESDWRIVERGWRAHVLGEARRFDSAAAAIEALRAEQPGISDQQLPPFVVSDPDGPVGPVRDGDAVLVFNFRGDRVVEISRAFTEGDEFDAFDRQSRPRVLFAGMLQYDGDLALPEHFLVTPPSVRGTISEYLVGSGVSQFACAETQKYGHVTYFWNGNRSARFSEALETYRELPSDRVPFEQRPWMQSAQTADAVIEALHGGAHRFIRTNLAGGDMVGHTGDLQAATMAIEAVDLAVGRIAAAVEAAGGCLMVTADHGNADDMVERDAEGQPQCRADGSPRWRTSHTLNPVPLYIVGAPGWRLRDDLPAAGLANVAATLIDLLGFVPPGDYEPSLLEQA